MLAADERTFKPISPNADAIQAAIGNLSLTIAFPKKYKLQETPLLAKLFAGHKISPPWPFRTRPTLPSLARLFPMRPFDPWQPAAGYHTGRYCRTLVSVSR